MTLVIALPLSQVLKAVVAHLAIQYGLDLILVLTVDESCGWGWCRTLAWNGIWMHNRQFVSGELPLTYLTLDSFSLSLFPLSIHHSLLLPFYIFTGS
jgi:hypothetical protein